MARFKSIFSWSISTISGGFPRRAGLYRGSAALRVALAVRAAWRSLKGLLLLGLIFGGAQGAVGWFMVLSGFDPELLDVSAYRLVMHLGAALLLYAYIIFLALAFWTTAEPGARFWLRKTGLRVRAVLETRLAALFLAAVLLCPALRQLCRWAGCRCHDEAVAGHGQWRLGSGLPVAGAGLLAEHFENPAAADAPPVADQEPCGGLPALGCTQLCRRVLFGAQLAGNGHRGRSGTADYAWHRDPTLQPFHRAGDHALGTRIRQRLSCSLVWSAAIAH